MIWIIGADTKGLEGDIYASTFNGTTWSTQALIFNGTFSTGAFHVDSVAEGDNIRLFYGIQNESLGVGYILYHGDTNTWDTAVTQIGTNAAYQIPKVVADGSTYYLMSTDWATLLFTSTTTPNSVPWPDSSTPYTAASGYYTADPTILKYGNSDGTADLIIFHSPGSDTDGSQWLEYSYSTDGGTTWSSSIPFSDALHGTVYSWDMESHAYLKDVSTIMLVYSTTQRGVSLAQGDVVVSELKIADIGKPHYTTIQDAVDAASSGDTILVGPGTYAGEITINKSLTLLGDPGDTTPGPGVNAPVIDGGSLPGDGILIDNGVSNVIIQGFEFANFTSDDTGIGNGISAWEASTSNITVQDNYFHDLEYNGILVGNDSALGDHTNWLVKGNIVDNVGYIGFELTNTSNSTIEGNIIHLDTPEIGAIFSSARRSETGLTIKDNVIDGTPSTAYPVIYIYAYDLDMPNPTLSNVLIEGNIIETVGTPAQIYIRNIGTGTITGVTVQENSLTTLRNMTAATIDASDNWWGTTVASEIAAGISGTGSVDFTPFLASGDADPGTIGFQATYSTLYVDDGGSQIGTIGRIQEAVDAVEVGGTVNVLAGEYIEQVVITKNLSLLGEDDATTFIKAFASMPSCFTTPSENRPIVCIKDGAIATVSDFTIDGLGLGNTNNRIIGVGFRNAGGTLSNSTIKDIRNTPFSGAQYGVAVYAYNVDPTEYTINVIDNVITGFQKNAMALNAGDTTPMIVNVTGNTITGAGTTGVTAQNGIQVWAASGSGTVDNNTISGIAYSGPGYVATSILNYYTELDSTNNTINDSHMGIYYYEGYGSINGNVLTIIDSNEYADGIYASDPPDIPLQPYDPPTRNIPAAAPNSINAPTASTITVEIADNSLTFVGSDKTDSIGIEADGGYDTSNLIVDAFNNLVYGFDYGMIFWQCDPEDGGCSGAMITSLDINYNNLIDNNTGLYLGGNLIINPTIHHNRIFSDGGVGLYNDLSLSLTAENNWWGCNAGTVSADCDSLVGTVDADPWLILESAIGGTPTSGGLFFSEYLEGSSNNKALELYNGTGAAVDLMDYKVILYSNGTSTPTNTLTWATPTPLAAGDVYVIANAGSQSNNISRSGYNLDRNIL